MFDEAVRRTFIRLNRRDLRIVTGSYNTIS